MSRKKDDTISFEGFDDEDVFFNLMNFAKVEPLQKEKEEAKPETLFDCEPLIFEDDPEINDGYSDAAQVRKLANDGREAEPKKRATSQKQRKVKINRKFRADATLDLHGETRESAMNMTRDFLEQSSKKKLKTVLIITGQGHNSGKKGGVLKNYLWSWLEETQSSLVSGFRLAPPFLGGRGAILVFLR